MRMILPSAPPVAIRPSLAEMSKQVMFVCWDSFLHLFVLHQYSWKLNASKNFTVPLKEVQTSPISLTYRIAVISDSFLGLC